MFIFLSRKIHQNSCLNKRDIRSVDFSSLFSSCSSFWFKYVSFLTAKSIFVMIKLYVKTSKVDFLLNISDSSPSFYFEGLILFSSRSINVSSSRSTDEEGTNINKLSTNELPINSVSFYFTSVRFLFILLRFSFVILFIIIVIRIMLVSSIHHNTTFRPVSSIFLRSF